MINLKCGLKLEIALLLITDKAQAVDISTMNYTPQIDMILRNITKGNSLLLSKTAIVEYAAHQSSVLDNEDKNVMVLSNDEGFTASFNMESDEGQDFPSICYNSLFDAMTCACLYADKNELNFIHSRQLIKQTNPTLFVIGGKKLVTELAKQIDTIIHIEINPEEKVFVIKHLYEQVSIETHPRAMPLKDIELKLFKRKESNPQQSDSI